MPAGLTMNVLLRRYVKYAYFYNHVSTKNKSFAAENTAKVALKLTIVAVNYG